ncbi:hypothetical protein [Lysinibacillus odysseyi]|uniref:Leucyl-tRNA synthetase n=1 Tax=Lysinibacillus odysseyi 34hs-1 = NBRC 100172 TaxID=1220589 RepID=A0A0A3JNB8_9BACI|nr:hypothetical protein [Lysinibacillus odysseyi]KGR88517.1 leucyl-tRNA synthetase [Lysinibacillus odysseyi 34hs-1 = NBRC 100172]
MIQIDMITEPKPINISHHTYKRECRYTRGVHISLEDFQQIINSMCSDTRIYFDFHNSAKQLKSGEYFNGHAGLARQIDSYYRTMKNTEIVGINNGLDFYVKII